MDKTKLAELITSIIDKKEAMDEKVDMKEMDKEMCDCECCKSNKCTSCED